MKKKTILYLFTILITFFCYNLNVNAAQEMTCTYEKHKDYGKLVLVQTSDGKQHIYINDSEDDLPPEGPGWKKFDYKVRLNDKDITEINSCPASVLYYSNSNFEKYKIVRFYSEVSTSVDSRLLNQIQSYNYAYEFNNSGTNDNSQNTTPNSNGQELSCMYKKGDLGKTLLIQYSNGERIFYEHLNDDATAESLGWEKRNDWKISIEDIKTKNDKGNLTRCPKYAIVKSVDDKTKYFSDKTISYFTDLVSLEDNGELFSIKEPSQSSLDSASGMWLDKLTDRYTASCIYEQLVEYGQTGTNKGFHRIQINYGKNDLAMMERDPEKGEYSGKNINAFPILNVNNNQSYVFKISSNITHQYFIDTYGGSCPKRIRVYRSKITDLSNTTSTEITTEKINSLDMYYFLTEVKGNNPITGDKLSLDGILKPSIIPGTPVNSCEELLGEEISGYLNVAWNIVKIGIPILLIGLGIIDFAQAVFAGKDDGMKKAQSKFIKRLIIAIVIFLIPIVLETLLGIANSIWPNIGTDICGILF